MLPRWHQYLTRTGTFSEPEELADVREYLRDLRSRIEHDIRSKTYLSLDARTVPQSALGEARKDDDPFVHPIQQVIRQVVGSARGGDSASAQIAAVNRRSKVVRDILKTLTRVREPLVLLGDPGTGKTMTLQQTARDLAETELRRVFPDVTVYVRLGDFYVDGAVGPDDVWDFVVRSTPVSIRHRMESLRRAGRLIILFDGMDEMSRDRYSEHTEALSLFAGRLSAKTLLSCRITDFSPKFVHQRLVLLPFDRGQIASYLNRSPLTFPISIDGEEFSVRKLARLLVSGGTSLDATNPFVLWLLCFHLEERKSWPRSRVELLEFFNEKNYERKEEEAPDDEDPFPPAEEAFAAWARVAYAVSSRNRGTSIAVETLVAGNAEIEAVPQDMLRVGKLCGVLRQSGEEHEDLIRFEHHRFQEYFAAVHIANESPNIEWLDKLDAPRWQETMVNLVLLGGGGAPLQALAESISSSVAKRREADELHPFDVDVEDAFAETPVEALELESELADRVEFASRITRHAQAGTEGVDRSLLVATTDALDYLVTKGNPITQVKMMRSCLNVPGLSFVKTLRKPLQSPIGWVRNQALTLIGGSDIASKALGTNIGAEIGYDLANGQLLRRAVAYGRIAWDSRRIAFWWCLAAGILCDVVSLGSHSGMGEPPRL